MTNQLSAVDLLCQGTMKAAVLILKDRGITEFSDEFVTSLTNSLRNVLLTKFDEVSKEWREAIEARMSEGWLRELMNVQCNKLALDAIQAMEAENDR